MAPSLRQEHLTMSMTIFLSDCLCFFVMFWKISQFSSWSSLKPTARWWFSSTDSSLYMSASSESEKKKKKEEKMREIMSRLVQTTMMAVDTFEKLSHVHLLVLMRNWLETPGWSTSWMAAAKIAARISRSVKTAWGQKLNKTMKKPSQLKGSNAVQHFLYVLETPKSIKSVSLHLVQVWTGEYVWIGPRPQHEDCCGRLHPSGSDPPASSYTSQTCLLGS